jgi:ABC-type glutathione transport system ATPase component
VAYVTAGALDEAARAEVTALLAALQARGISVLATGADLDLLPAAESIGVLAAGLLVARPRVPAALRTGVGDGAATLLSVAPLTARATPALEAVAAMVLQALADGLVVAGTGAGPAPSRPDLHQWQLSAGGAANVGHAARQIQGGPAGAERIARALGLRDVGTVRVQQARLW